MRKRERTSLVVIGNDEEGRPTVSHVELELTHGVYQESDYMARVRKHSGWMACWPVWTGANIIMFLISGVKEFVGGLAMLFLGLGAGAGMLVALPVITELFNLSFTPVHAALAFGLIYAIGMFSHAYWAAAGWENWFKQTCQTALISMMTICVLIYLSYI